MEDWLKTMVSSSSSKFPLSNMKVIGSSHESRPIYVMEIDFEENSKKPIILVEAGAHAREWIGPAVALALIDRLIYSTNMNGNKTYTFRKPTSLVVNFKHFFGGDVGLTLP